MRAVLLAFLINLLVGPWFGRSHAADDKKVTCGSVIKLQHFSTKYRLHSHDIPYGSGSGQQSVTGFEGGDDTNCYWIVRGDSGETCSQGQQVEKNQRIRLQHARTRRWLHSHLHRSPLSANQEVSAFGGDSDSDTGDVWIIEWDDKKQRAWRKDMKIRLKHADTQAYLMSHERKYSNPIPGQQEVCGTNNRKDKNTMWFAGEGVYFTDSPPPVHDEL